MERPTLIRTEATYVPASPAEIGSIRSFDYGSRDRVSPTRLRQAQTLYEKCLRDISATLAAFLGTAVNLKLSAVVETARSESIAAAGSPTCILSLSLRPFRANALLEISPTLLYPALETILGGDTASPIETRAHLTEIEQSVLDLFFEMILRDLRERWRTAGEIDFRVHRLWTDPVAAAASEPDEQLVLFEGEMSIDQAAGKMNLGMPVSVIEQLWDGSEQDRAAEREDSDSAQRLGLLHVLDSMPMNVEARLQGATVLVRDLCGLKPGDVLTVLHPIDGAVEGLVNEKTKFRGHLLSNGPHVTFQIDACVRSAPSPIGPS